MAVFEKGSGARRLYSLSSDGLPLTRPGGKKDELIVTGTVLVHTDTGDKFIHNGDTREWFPFSGDEDVVSALIDAKNAIYELLPHLQVIRAATATMANDQSGGDYSTDDE